MKTKSSITTEKIKIKGEPAWLIRGFTSDIKDVLLANGATWDGGYIGWLVAGDTLPRAIKDVINGVVGKVDPAPPPLPAQLRAWGKAMDKQIDPLLKAKRKSKTEEAQQLQMVQAKFFALADAWDSSTVPEILKGIRRKELIVDLTLEKSATWLYIRYANVEELDRLTRDLNAPERIVLDELYHQAAEFEGRAQVLSTQLPKIEVLLEKCGASQVFEFRQTLAAWRAQVTAGLDTPQKWLDAMQAMKLLGAPAAVVIDMREVKGDPASLAEMADKVAAELGYTFVALIPVPPFEPDGTDMRYAIEARYGLEQGEDWLPYFWRQQKHDYQIGNLVRHIPLKLQGLVKKVTSTGVMVTVSGDTATHAWKFEYIEPIGLQMGQWVQDTQQRRGRIARIDPGLIFYLDVTTKRHPIYHAPPSDLTIIPEPEKFIYGCTSRPPEYASVPEGWTDADEHPDYRHGTITYFWQLTPDEVYRYELLPVSENAYRYGLGEKVLLRGVDEAVIAGYSPRGRYIVSVDGQQEEGVSEKELQPFKPAFGAVHKVTPLRQQYLKLKAEYPGFIMFYRLGDFYETFDEDAEIAARELDLVLTGRPVSKDQRVPMAGVPHHALEPYIDRLLEKGYSVAVVEQVSEPDGTGIVERRVERVLEAPAKARTSVLSPVPIISPESPATPYSGLPTQPAGHSTRAFKRGDILRNPSSGRQGVVIEDQTGGLVYVHILTDGVEDTERTAWTAALVEDETDAYVRKVNEQARALDEKYQELVGDWGAHPTAARNDPEIMAATSEFIETASGGTLHSIEDVLSPVGDDEPLAAVVEAFQDMVKDGVERLKKTWETPSLTMS
jgi:hypothetical protein